jgi:putative flippase GtrA
VAWLGAVTVVFLVVGGLAFAVKSGVLNLALDVSLPLLLLWAAAASISMIWRGPAGLRCHARRGGE